MKAYIATGYRNRDAYSQARRLLTRAGYEITFDWTLHQPPPTHQREQRDSFMVWAAEREEAAIREADLVLVLLPGGRGTCAELGMALALRKDVILHAPQGFNERNGDPECIFFLSAPLASDWAALERMVQRHAEGAAVAQ